MKLEKKIAVRLGATVLLSGVAAPALARVAFNDAPKPNEIQSKYLEFTNEAGGLACKPKGKLQELLGEPNKCYLDLDECAPAKDAVAGKLDAGFVGLFGDLLVLAPGDKVEFAYACPGGDDPRFLEGLAIQGIGYAKADAHLEKLLALSTPERLKSFSGAAQRELLVNALVNVGAKHKDKVTPALANLVKAEAKTLGFKQTALQALARHQSDAAVEYCLEQLKSGESKDLHDACILYLGERKAKDALPVLLRGFEKKTDVTARALGLLGDKGAVDTLKAHVDDKGARIAAASVVALVNLGEDKEYLPKLLLMIEGKAPLTKKDEEKKAEELAKAKKPKDTERVTKKWADKESKTDDQIAQTAAMEATYVVNPAAEKALTAALQKAAKTIDAKEWKTGVYARLALAQRGDKAAIAEAAKLLGDNKEDIRGAALNAVGGLYDSPGATFAQRGRGIVADASLVPALLSFIDNEQKKPQRSKAIHAIAAIRSFE